MIYPSQRITSLLFFLRLVLLVFFCLFFDFIFTLSGFELLVLPHDQDGMVFAILPILISIVSALLHSFEVFFVLTFGFIIWPNYHFVEGAADAGLLSEQIGVIL